MKILLSIMMLLSGYGLASEGASADQKAEREAKRAVFKKLHNISYAGALMTLTSAQRKIVDELSTPPSKDEQK